MPAYSFTQTPKLISDEEMEEEHAGGGEQEDEQDAGGINTNSYSLHFQLSFSMHIWAIS